MGEDLCACCVCGHGTSDYRRVNSCDGCGAPYCSTACEKEGIEPTQDGEIYCVDCCSIEDMKDWIKAKTLNIKQAQITYQNKINKLEKQINEMKEQMKYLKTMQKLLK